MVLGHPRICAHWPGWVSSCIWSQAEPDSWAFSLLNCCHVFLFLSDIRCFFFSWCFISCMDSCLWTHVLPIPGPSEKCPPPNLSSPLNSSHSAVSWSLSCPRLEHILAPGLTVLCASYPGLTCLQLHLTRQSCLLAQLHFLTPKLYCILQSVSTLGPDPSPVWPTPVWSEAWNCY